MIKFDAGEHIYTIDGKVIPSVTQVFKKAGLTSSFYKKGAAQRGTEIHDLTEMMDLLPGFYPEDSEHDGYLKAWNAFKENSGVRIIEAEKIVYSVRYWFAGTLDRIVEMNDQLWILDIKTGVKAKWHPIQLAAYDIALSECTDYKVGRGLIVYIKKDGTYKIETVSGAKLDREKNEFFRILGGTSE